MTTYSSVLPTFTSAATANLKDVMNSVGTLMTNAGWALASDTGQVDISTVVYSSTSGTTYGYKIWYLNDSQHSTYPIYLRLMWKMSATSTLAIAYTIGHATDGAGNITGFKIGSDTTYMHTGAAASNTVWGVSGNASKAVTLDGYGFWALCPGTNTQMNTNGIASFCISREWDNSTGSIKTGGNYTFSHGAMSFGNGGNYSVNRSAGTYLSIGRDASFCPGATTTSQSGASTDVFRHYAVYPTIVVNGALLSYHTGEVTQWNTFSAQPLTGGSARTYLATGVPGYVRSTSTDGLAVLWE